MSGGNPDTVSRIPICGDPWRKCAARMTAMHSTRRPTRIPVLLALVVVIPTLRGSATQSVNQEDAAVFSAVIEHTLRDSFQQYAGASASGTRATVYVAGRTIPACDTARDPNLGCLDQSDVGLTLKVTQLVERIPPEHLPSEAARAELTANFRSRNAASHELPMPRANGVTLLTPEQLREVQQRLYNGQRANYASFSLPAYSRDGHAVVYVAYVCGNLCGNWWLFLLEKVDSRWRVQGRQLLGIA